MGSSPVIDAFNNATEEDLSAVRKTIEQVQQTLNGLKEIERVLQKKFEKPLPKKMPETIEDFEPKGTRKPLTPLARMIMKFLEEEPKKRAKLTDIAGALGRSEASIKQSVAHSRWRIKRDGPWAYLPSANNEGDIEASPEDTELEEESKDDEQRDKMFDYLSANGPTKPRLLAIALGIEVETINELADHEWFQKTPQGYKVA